jgi:hypothetical protein
LWYEVLWQAYCKKTGFFRLSNIRIQTWTKADSAFSLLKAVVLPELGAYLLTAGKALDLKELIIMVGIKRVDPIRAKVEVVVYQSLIKTWIRMTRNL